jgi:hypothetical protein
MSIISKRLISFGLRLETCQQLQRHALSKTQIRFNTSLKEPFKKAPPVQAKPPLNRNRLLLIFGGGVLTFVAVSYYNKHRKPNLNSPEALRYRPENITKISKHVCLTIGIIMGTDLALF